MLIKGHEIANIILGNTLSNDGLFGECKDVPIETETGKRVSACRKAVAVCG